MVTTRNIALFTASALLLTSCSAQPFFTTDGGCGTLVPSSLTPTILVDEPLLEEELPVIATDLEWEVTNLPSPSPTVYSAAITTAPFSQYLNSALDGLEGASPAVLVGEEEIFYAADRFAEISTTTGTSSSVTHQIVTPQLAMDSISGPAGPLVSAITHLPVTVVASCGSDFETTLQERLDGAEALGDGDNPASISPLDLEDASSVTIYPGHSDDLLSFSATEDRLFISASEPGWTPFMAGISPFFGEATFDELTSPALIQSYRNLSELDKNWLGLASQAVGQPFNHPAFGELGSSQWTLTGNLWGDSELLELNQGQQQEHARLVNNQFVINLYSQITAENTVTEVMNSGLVGNVALMPDDLEYFLIYSAFFRKVDGPTNQIEIRYGFNRVSIGSDGVLRTQESSFVVEDFGQADLFEQVAGKLVANPADLENLQINGTTETEFLAQAEEDRLLNKFVAKFSDGQSFLGLESGVVLVPGYDATDLTTPISEGFIGPESMWSPNSPGYFGSSQSDPGPDPMSVLNEVTYTDTPEGALQRAIDLDLSIPEGPGPQAKTIFDPTSVSFTLDASADFLKLDFVLGMTETGNFNEDTNSWSGYISEFPDGLGIFVKGSGQSWLGANNCAAIPTTNSYLSMISSGVLPPTSFSADRLVARENYAGLVSKTVSADYTPSTTRFVSLDADQRLANPDLIAPPMLAFSSGTSMNSVGFLTTTMTCVVDVSEYAASGGQVDVAIVVANLRDAVLPPAMFLSGSSVRFSQTQAAATAELEQQLRQDLGSDSVSLYSGPVVTKAIPAAARAGEVVELIGTGLNRVTSISIDGEKVEMLSGATASSMKVRLPKGLVAGSKSPIVVSDAGSLRVQSLLRIVGKLAQSALLPKASVKRKGSERARVQLDALAGAGKVQVMLNGREIAWINATAIGDPKLNSGRFIRNLKLTPGRKNVIEVLVDGKRIKRVSYFVR